MRSQKGAAANWKGLDYQKKFIAFLAVGMLSEDSVIKRIDTIILTIELGTIILS